MTPAVLGFQGGEESNRLHNPCLAGVSKAGGEEKGYILMLSWGPQSGEDLQHTPWTHLSRYVHHPNPLLVATPA